MHWLRKVLCYPSGELECYLKRKKILEDAGVIELINEGSYEIDGFRVLGRGHSSVVVAVLLQRDLLAAAKILRTDSKRDDLTLECKLLARGVPVTPAPLYCSPEIIVMEFIRGTPLKNAGGLVKGCSDVALLALKIIGAAYYLDVLGIDHKELSDPSSHVIITEKGHVKILDLETASLRRGCNVCRVVSWMFFRSRLMSLCSDGFGTELMHLQPILRRYKKGDLKAVTALMCHLARLVKVSHD